MIEGTPPLNAISDAPSLWSTCVDRLAQEIPEQQFNTWIRPLSAVVAPDASKVTISVANRFKMDWIRAQYSARIAALLENIHQAPVVLELVLAPREGPSRTSPAPRTVQDQVLAELPDVAPAEANNPTGPRTRLNPALTFTTLVEGSANRMARAAAMHVAGSLGQLYNPLFIYGGVGLGKTHLVHAIGNHLLADRPQAKVLYIHAEQFVSDVVKSYQRKTFD
jgi:chromosomal replication initiator protein